MEQDYPDQRLFPAAACACLLTWIVRAVTEDGCDNEFKYMRDEICIYSDNELETLYSKRRRAPKPFKKHRATGQAGAAVGPRLVSTTTERANEHFNLVQVSPWPTSLS